MISSKVHPVEQIAEAGTEFTEIVVAEVASRVF
jgi:hypothetical protein